jgi:hypothetical protein
VEVFMLSTFQLSTLCIGEYDLQVGDFTWACGDALGRPGKVRDGDARSNSDNKTR